MYLKYKNLSIRNVTTNDAEQLSIWWNDGKIMEHTGFPNGTGETAQDILDSLKTDTDDTHRRLIIEIDNLAVGEMSYRNKGNGVAEIGIKIFDFSKQNKGNGKILLSMLINSLYRDLDLRRSFLIQIRKTREHSMFMSNLALLNCVLTKIHGQIKLEKFSHQLTMNYIRLIFTTSRNNIIRTR